MIIDKSFKELKRLENGDYVLDEIETEEDLEIDLDDRLIITYYIKAKGYIEARGSIEAGLSIEAGYNIEAGESIEAKKRNISTIRDKSRKLY